ncbi:MAG: class I adenylate-forming enzyme family protein [Kofleriaceae bacterium]
MIMGGQMIGGRLDGTNVLTVSVQIVPDILRRAARRAPDRTAIQIDGGPAITYGDWWTRAQRTAHGLIARGVRPGDRVAIAFANDRAIEFSVAYMATHLAGAIAVPINMRFSDHERERVLAHAEPRLILGTWGEAPSAIEQAGNAADLPSRAPQDIADLLYTSGTTGMPKGVAAPHANVVAFGKLMTMFDGQTFLHAIPMYTFAGCHGMQLGSAGALMTTVVMPEFDVTRWYDLVETKRPSLTFVVPAMAVLILDAPELGRRDLSSLKMVMHGAAPMPPEASRRLSAAVPDAWIANSYGMTEAGSVGCLLPPGEAARRPGAVGKPTGGTEVRIVRDDGALAAPREVGEVALHRSDVPARFYFRDEEATRATWRAGWLMTGDLGFLDEDGYLYLVDRKKDLIIRGGHNVHAGEVDAVLCAHPAVREAATVGIPHRVLGEDVGAFVVLRAGASVTSDELIAFAREQLGDYKVPRRIFFERELPRNALGKVVKRELRDRTKALVGE